MTAEVMIDRYDPWRVKDELTALECEPVETRREVVTESASASKTSTYGVESSRGNSYTRSRGREQGRGKSAGFSREMGANHSQTEGRSVSVGSITSRGHATSRGRATSSGEGTTSSTVLMSGEMVMPDQYGALGFGGNVIQTSSEATGTASSHFNSVTDIESESDSWSEGETRTVGGSASIGSGLHRSHGQSVSDSRSQSYSQGESQGVQHGQSSSSSLGVTVGKNVSRSMTPWHEYHKRRIVSSRQFLTKEEQLTLFLQKIKDLPRGHFLLKVPGHEAAFVRAPFVKTPQLSSRRRAEALERIHQQPYYSTPEEIEKEEQARSRKIQDSLPPQTRAAKMKGGISTERITQTKKKENPKEKEGLWDQLDPDSPIGKE